MSGKTDELVNVRLVIHGHDASDGRCIELDKAHEMDAASTIGDALETLNALAATLPGIGVNVSEGWVELSPNVESGES